MDTLSLKPECKYDECIQGTIDSSNFCICNDPKYPVPIILNKKIYCYSDNYSKYPNSTFVPGPGKDPSQNSCVCGQGYTKDTNTPYCKKKKKSGKLEEFITRLNNISYPDQIQNTIGKYDNFQIIEGQMEITNSEINPERSLIECMNKAKSLSKRQVIFDGTHCYIGDAVSDKVTDKENCQSAIYMA
jgi:hypothetical protein